MVSRFECLLELLRELLLELLRELLLELLRELLLELQVELLLELLLELQFELQVELRGIELDLVLASVLLRFVVWRTPRAPPRMVLRIAPHLVQSMARWIEQQNRLISSQSAR